MLSNDDGDNQDDVSKEDDNHDDISRQEFGSSEVQPGPDSGYVSHSSGGGYPKLLLQPVMIIMLS